MLGGLLLHLVLILVPPQPQLQPLACVEPVEPWHATHAARPLPLDDLQEGHQGRGLENL